MTDRPGNPWRLVRGLAGRYRARIALGTGLIVVTLASGIGLLALSGWFITTTGLAGIALAAGGIAMIELFAPGAGIRFFAVSRTLARYGERLVNHDTTLRLLADLRIRTLERFLALDTRSLLRITTGDRLQRVTADVDSLDHALLRVWGPTLAAALTTLVATGLFMLVDSRMAGVLVVGLVIPGLLLAVLATASGKRLNGELVTRVADFRELLVERLQGLAEVRAFGRSDISLQEVHQTSQALLALEGRVGRMASLVQGLSTAIGLGTVWLMLVLGLWLHQTGSLSGPWLALVVLGMLALIEAWSPLPRAWQFLEQSRAAAARIEQTGPEIPLHPKTPVPSPITLPAGWTIENVRFAYGAHADPVFDDFSLDIPAGQRLLVKGPSGQGKSTLAGLLVRSFDPDQGKIWFGGADLTTLSPEQLFDHVACLPQTGYLFQDTLAANLEMACPGADKAALLSALEQACLAAWVGHLPDGLETRVGELGLNLSGGQGRRLALARLFLQNPAAVVLDEPTRGLDHATARSLSANLDRWLADRTTVIISHQTSGLPPVDREITL